MFGLSSLSGQEHAPGRWNSTKYLNHHYPWRFTEMGDKSPKKEVKAPKKDIKEKRKEKQEKKAAGKTGFNNQA